MENEDIKKLIKVFEDMRDMAERYNELFIRIDEADKALIYQILDVEYQHIVDHLGLLIK